MTDACALPRKVDEKPRRPFEASSIDLADCHRFEMCVGLYEHETAGLRIETWPPVVVNQFEKHIALWREKHASVEVRAITCALVAHAGARQCVVVLHYAAKG
jgi:hypothetical protein